jgi:hypothetical protein
VELCKKCYDRAGWENNHSDEGHGEKWGEPKFRLDCPLCKEEGLLPKEESA